MASKKTDNPNEEASIFQQEMAGAVRYQDDKSTPFKPSLKPFPLPPNPRVTDEGLNDEFSDLNIETGEVLEFIRPGVQQRLFHDLRRGHLPPQELLDLHGLRVAEARHALRDFLIHARRHRLRIIQVIHGKGQRSQDQQPILKQKLNQWLRQRKEVLAFCSAPKFDGGTGAAYVLLSRKGDPADDWR